VVQYFLIHIDSSNFFEQCGKQGIQYDNKPWIKVGINGSDLKLKKEEDIRLKKMLLASIHLCVSQEQFE
jgi:hypothetical protein